MQNTPPKANANTVNWKKAFLITLPLAALAILATALVPKPVITIAPYDGTTIRGARVDVLPPVEKTPTDPGGAAPDAAPPADLDLPYEEAPLATGTPDQVPPRAKLKQRLSDRRESRRDKTKRFSGRRHH